MEISEFSRLLRIGLGRPILFLRDHDAMPYREAILHACLHNLAYDPQCEDRRGPYLFDLIRSMRDDAFYRGHILTALARTSEDWDRDSAQLFELARLFAETGDTEARQALYDKVATNAAVGSAAGADEVIKLAGLDGLLFVAERLGQRLLSEDDAWEDDYLLRLAEEQVGEEAVRQAVEAASADRPRLAAFMTAVRADRARQRAEQRDRPDYGTMSYEQIKERIEEAGDTVAMAHLTWWAKHASDDDLVQVAANLLTETDRRRLLAYLRIFQQRPFPLDHHRLIALAQGYDDRLSWAAFRALAQIRHPQVRELALGLLAAGQQRAAAVGLLASNYQAGDDLLIEAAVVQEADLDQLHSLGFSVDDVAQANPDGNYTRALLLLYERGPCSLCRRKWVKRLHALGTLPDWVVEECHYDANLELRALVRQYRG